MTKTWKRVRSAKMLADDTFVNKQGVRFDAANEMIIVDRPLLQMRKQQALVHAAYLVMLADSSKDCGPFIETLARVGERMTWERNKK